MTENVFDRINNAIRNTEGSLVNVLSAIAPWGAPLAPAYMAYHGMVEKLTFDPTIALILAGVIEILGLATVSTTLQFWQHNRRYSTEYKRQPVKLAGGMFLFYLVVILTTNVLLEWPEQGIYNPIIARGLLSLLSVPAAITMAARTQYAELRRDMEDEKRQRKLSGKKTETHQKAESSDNAEVYRQSWRDLPMEDRQIVSTMATREIMQRYGVEERTARNWRTRASSNGKTH